MAEARTAGSSSSASVWVCCLNSPRKRELLGFMSRKMHCVIRKGPTEACNQAPTFPKLFFFFVLLLEKIFFPSNCKPHLKASSPVHSLEKLQLDTTSDKKNNSQT